MTYPDYNPRDVLREGAALLDTSVSRLLASTTTNRSAVRVRAACAYVLRNRLRMSLPEIGRVMHRDHTTVHNALATRCKRPDTMALVQALEGRLAKQREAA